MEYVKYLKLSIAVAIIRSRPSGLTGQQYAQQLCARYQQTQLGWKHEAHRLKQHLEVILQQEPLLGQLLVSWWLMIMFANTTFSTFHARTLSTFHQFLLTLFTAE